ncbi:dynein light intermediate chain 2 [Plasmodium gonderi]|uniref:Dynein light intermediate chain 2 n=1 Tax=Plasmodium gonderi TaxID=77519 RepID=A0A1Y1JC74_PLAGO|nr:dynein light intermediate chain 2 [Plasmodium gonderi]GAW80129.1 dynein light intermediate chain 2 [Plasmodium gonderi]
MKRENKNLSNASMNILKKSNTTTKQGGLKGSTKFRETYKEKWSVKVEKDNAITSRKSSVNLIKESVIKVVPNGKMNEEESGVGVKNKIEANKKNAEKSNVSGKFNRGNDKAYSKAYDENKNVKQEGRTDRADKKDRKDRTESTELNAEEEKDDKEANNAEKKEERNGEINLTRRESQINQEVSVAVMHTEDFKRGFENENGEKEGIDEKVDKQAQKDTEKNGIEDEDLDSFMQPFANELVENYQQYNTSEESEYLQGEREYNEDNSDDLNYENNDDDEEEGEIDKRKYKEGDDAHEKSSIYQNILKKLNMGKNEEIENSHIIILGNKDVGKSCLVKSLQEIPLHGNKEGGEVIYQNGGRVLPLDYACLDVKNLDEKRKMNDMKRNSHIWILEHSSYVSSLIKNLKKFQNIKKIVVLVCTDLYKPYNIMSDINHWIEVLYVLFEKLHSDYNLDVLHELKVNLQNYVYNYKKEAFEKKKNKNQKADTNSKDDGKTGNGDDTIDKNSLYDINSDDEMFKVKKEELIKINLSFPIFFIICKSDGYEILNNRTYQGYIDVIIAYLRNLAVNYQAAIIFCNTVNKKEPKNVELLYRYIMHRLYNFPFNENAILDDYDKIFIPSGYDNMDLINESIQNTFVQNFNKPYDSIIIKPISNRSIVEHSQNVVVDNYFNDFLASLGSDVNTNPGDGAEDDDVDDYNDNGDSTRSNNRDGNNGEGKNMGDKKINVTLKESRTIVDKESNNENNASRDKNDKSLHSFFQSLLAKGRSKSPSAPNIPLRTLDKKKNMNL